MIRNTSAPTTNRTIQTRASITKARAKDTPTEALVKMRASTELHSACQQQFDECMDKFCAVIDEKQKRCSCSSNLSKYAKVEAAVKEANNELNDVAQRIRYIGLSADEIRAIMSATEAELAMNKNYDRTETKNMLDIIASMIKNPTVSTSSGTTGVDASGLLDIDLSFSSASSFFDISSLTASSSNNITNLRGRALYDAAKKRCNTVLTTCKNSGATQDQITGNYDLAIDKDCIAYEQGLTNMNESLVSNVRNATVMLQKARLAVRQNKNMYDAKGCVSALNTCMMDDMVCGADYSKCLDPAKKYIDENGEVILGQRISNIVDFMKNYDNAKINAAFLKSVTTLTCTGDGGCIVAYLLQKIGTGEKATDGGLCRAVLDKCQAHTYSSGKYNPYNEVIVNYIQRVMPNIYSAQRQTISDYASTCITDVSACYNQQVSQMSGLSTSNNINGIYNVMRGACRSVALTCAYAVFIDDAKSCPPTTVANYQETCIDSISGIFYQKLLCPENSTYQSTAGKAGSNNYVNEHCQCNTGYSYSAGSCVYTSGMVTCRAGTYGSTCATCTAGYSCAGGISDRVICNAGTWSGAGATTCTACATGYTTSGNGATSSSACNVPTGGGTTNCSSGQYSSGGTCTTCTAGYSCAGGTADRVICNTGTWSGAGATTCTACATGYTTSGNGATSSSACNVPTGGETTSCPAGQYSSGGTCTTCTAGYSCAGGTSNRAICSLGTWASGGATTCTGCITGYTTSRTGATSASECNIPSVTNCAAGHYALNDTCVACTSGYSCAGGTANRVICPIGAYSTGGAITCTPCPTGHSTSVTGASSPVVCIPIELIGETPNCTPGTYYLGNECISCYGGHSCAGGAAFAEVCSVGTYATGGAVTCTPCPTGYSTSGVGASSCDILAGGGGDGSCAPGTYYLGNKCVTCTAGYSCNGGTADRKICTYGTWAAAGAAGCTPCRTGYTTSGTGTISWEWCNIAVETEQGNQTSCPAGKYLSNGYCMTCIAGYSCAGGTAEPWPCGGGSYSSAGKSVCTACPEGYTSVGLPTSRDDCFILSSQTSQSQCTALFNGSTYTSTGGFPGSTKGISIDGGTTIDYAHMTMNCLCPTGMTYDQTSYCVTAPQNSTYTKSCHYPTAGIEGCATFNYRCNPGYTSDTATRKCVLTSTATCPTNAIYYSTCTGISQGTNSTPAECVAAKCKCYTDLGYKHNGSGACTL